MEVLYTLVSLIQLLVRSTNLDIETLVTAKVPHANPCPQTDLAYGIQHGCLPPNRLLNELPLGVDRLNEIFSADADGRLMALFLYHFRRWGDTLEQVFLGTKAFGTIDPRNLEAILFTQFNGRVKYSRGRTCANLFRLRFWSPP